jgi:MFS superfamily sulfate permease-like transporter
MIILWEKLPLAKLRNAIPPTLIAVLAATVLAAVMNLQVKHVELPNSIVNAINWPDLSLIPQLGWVILTQGLIVAFIASAETLLSASAIDRMAPENKAKYDKELVAQGVGNTLCGIVGALPLTGVIVRSSVNVKAGAVSRRSAILHGLWLLLFVVAFPVLLKQIPTAVLAALLVYTGYKLLNVGEIKAIAKHSKSEALILIATMATIVAVDLLTGVLTGIVLSILKILYVFCKIDIVKEEEENQVTLNLVGAATFLSLPKITDEIEKLDPHTDLHIDFSGLIYMDHACLEAIKAFEKQFKEQGGNVTIEWGHDQKSLKKSVLRRLPDAA